MKLLLKMICHFKSFLNKRAWNHALLFLLLLFFPSMYSMDVVDDNLECSICLEKIEFEHLKKLECTPQIHHNFHYECIDDWLYHNPTCPLCRAPAMNKFFEILEKKDLTQADIKRVELMLKGINQANQIQFQDSLVTLLELSQQKGLIHQNRIMRALKITSWGLGVGSALFVPLFSLMQCTELSEEAQIRLGVIMPFYYLSTLINSYIGVQKFPCDLDRVPICKIQKLIYLKLLECGVVSRD